MMNVHAEIEGWAEEAASRACSGTRVCSACLAYAELWEVAGSRATADRCDFCGNYVPCVTYEVLGEIIAGSLLDFYIDVGNSGAFHDGGEWSETVVDAAGILGDWLGQLGSQVGLSLQEFAVAKADSVALGFVRRSDLWASLSDHDDAAWRRFLADSRTGSAQLAAEHLLAELNEDDIVMLQRVIDIAHMEGLIREGRPEIWRCREGREEDRFLSAQELGTAPAGLASAGRLNAQGHSCFYGSTSEKGAILESEKHSQANAEFWIGNFRPSQGLYYLDVFEVPAPPSPFTPGAVDSFDALRFLGKFAETISQPNDAADRQHYLPTQIFTEFLLASDDPPEAIRFRSSIDPSSENWVIFVDRDHCSDQPPPDGQGLHLVLCPNSARHVPKGEVQEPKIMKEIHLND